MYRPELAAVLPFLVFDATQPTKPTLIKFRHEVIVEPIVLIDAVDHFHYYR